MNAPYVTDEATGARWRLMLGDSCERLAEIPDASVHLSVYSPPFASLFTYSDTSRDLGNSRNRAEFFAHYRYIIDELLRVTMPGRRTCVHVAPLGMTKATHGEMGVYDFRGDVVRAYIDAGWIYDNEVTVDKDPQAQAIRTKSHALLFVTKDRDSAMSRPALPDYVLFFRKPGDNPIPIKNDVTNEEWILWARPVWIPKRDPDNGLINGYDTNKAAHAAARSICRDLGLDPDACAGPDSGTPGPVWYGIKETNTLNYRAARDDKDERHICPLQLDLIERCVRLWSNKDETVLSPFAGIGSEVYVAVKFGRRGVGIELKPSYWKTAVANLTELEQAEPMLMGEV